jgi:nitroimidazol reductase NimA-like FMN-containing flavoprotein (pyridoxamine 5'-phosphate oxidase superfamily)
MSDIADAPSYPVDKVNRVKRVHERGRYDHETVHRILDSAMLCHVSYVIDGQPYCTPTLFWREGTRLYWHGSSASRMLRNLSAGEPACLTVSHLDALVMARCGFNHSVDYRAAMCFGHARLVTDPEEKIHALTMMVDRFFPNRTAGLRQSTTQEIKATAVVWMEIERASAKIRAKGVGDTEEDYALPIYAERLPVRTVLGEPEPCPRLLAGVERGEDLRSYQPARLLDEALREAYEEAYR